MRTRLDQLTLHDIVELSCGEISVLLEDGDKPDEKEVLVIARKILDDYKCIASPKQAKIDMIEEEDTTKLQMREKCLRICMALITQNRPDMAKEVLIELDVSENLLTDFEAVKSRCKAMLDDVAYEIKRAKERAEDRNRRGDQTPSEIRKSWLAEVAFVMSVFRMNIDPTTTNAAIYANLVNQAGERSKMLAKMPYTIGMFM